MNIKEEIRGDVAMLLRPWIVLWRVIKRNRQPQPNRVNHRFLDLKSMDWTYEPDDFDC
ncbi:MAG: hypothetical protein ACI8V2_002941 [Candidatus Latescibacterota bacterium]|jgi:hypothetical protein